MPLAKTMRNLAVRIKVNRLLLFALCTAIVLTIFTIYFNKRFDSVQLAQSNKVASFINFSRQILEFDQVEILGDRFRMMARAFLVSENFDCASIVQLKSGDQFGWPVSCSGLIEDNRNYYVYSNENDIRRDLSVAVFVKKVTVLGPLFLEIAGLTLVLLMVVLVFVLVVQIRQRHIMRDAKERAEVANRAKDQFLAMMSHEIRTPLNGVLGVLEVLADSPLADKQKSYVSTARNSANTLLGIINDILDFSKIEAGKLKFDISSISIGELIERSIKIVEPQARSKGLNITSAISSNVPNFVLGDPGRLGQVLLNLLVNAVKFTDNGHIEVAVSSKPRTEKICALTIRVTDTGIGIPKDNHTDLFREFTTVDASYSRRFGGTGLGLAICRKLVVLMGGEIDFNSSEGKGSCFWFTVPLDFAEPPATLDEQDAIPFKSKSVRILLVEDNLTNQMIARAILEKAGHHVDTASNGVEAVEAAGRFLYDLILMDINMPEMDGIQATIAIRSLPGFLGEVPIIAMTALVMQGDRQRTLDAGMNDYISKPIDGAKLRAIVTEWGDADKTGDGDKSSTKDYKKLESINQISILIN